MRGLGISVARNPPGLIGVARPARSQRKDSEMANATKVALATGANKRIGADIPTGAFLNDNGAMTW